MLRRDGSARLWIAFGLSVLVHLLMGAAAARLPSSSPPDAVSDASPPRTPPRLCPPPPPDDPEVKVGIERSQRATITWIGFETPTEHEAPQAETEQPALTRDAPSSPVQPTETHTEPQPTPEQVVAAAELSPAREPATASAENAPRVTEPSPFSHEPSPVPLVELDPGAGIPLLLAAALAQDPVEADADRPEARPARAQPPSPSARPAPESADTPPGEEPRPGEADSRESDATSLRKPVVVRPGWPAAAEGLQIETRHLRLSLYGQVKATPSRLKLWATFDRAGRVRSVEWVTSTGLKELDEPVLDCVYSWRARGKALEDLPKENPKAGVRVPFEIVLR